MSTRDPAILIFGAFLFACVPSKPGATGTQDAATGSDASPDADSGQAGTDSGTLSDAGLSEDSGLPPCPNPNQHRCGTQCVDDNDVATCGDRCMPCPTVQNGTPTCDGNACGFQCGMGFFACLGECMPDAQAPCGISIDANTWTQLTQGDTGPRSGAAMFYLDDTKEYVLVGGSMGINVTPRPYDIQTLALTDTAWKNRFPLDKSWSPEIGNSDAPGFPNEYFGFQDSDGNTRPNWATYPGIPSYYQYAFNPVTKTLLMYLYNRTFSYDATARVWTPHSPATDPAGGEDSPRLLWGSMAFDEVDNKVVLFGGGNVLNDESRPGTWIYEFGNQTWRRVQGTEPGPRALSQLVTDPDRRKALLFGGDELDHLKSDTWVFDFAQETWQQIMPTTAPSPRGGHHTFFLPTSRATVLVGGFEYDSTTDYVASHCQSKPWEIWRFDWNAPTWELIKRFDPGEMQPDIWLSRNYAYAAAAGAGDVVVIHFKNGYHADQDAGETWALRIDPSVTDAAGTMTYGVAPGTEEWRTGPYDPAWYTAGIPAPDPTAFANLLSMIPENTWTEIDVPNRPSHNHDWGTAAIDPVRQVIFRWSGGHSAHSGTDVLEYNLETNRFSLSYPPEIPLDFEYTNDQTPGQWSFDNNPWMTGHTYKTYAYSSAVDRVVLYKRPYTYYYDPVVHDWELITGTTDMGGSMYTDVLCATPAGMVAWTPNGLWDLDIPTKTWTSLPVSGDSLPALSPDRNVLVHDGARDNLLLFASTGSDLGQVFEYDLATNVLSALNPQGQGSVEANTGSFVREAVYSPSLDLVVLGAAYDDLGTSRTPVYSVAENRWYAYAFDPTGIQSDFYDVSLGLVIDAQDRIWAINTASQLYILKVNPSTGDRLPL